MFGLMTKEKSFQSLQNQVKRIEAWFQQIKPHCMEIKMCISSNWQYTIVTDVADNQVYLSPQTYWLNLGCFCNNNTKWIAFFKPEFASLSQNGVACKARQHNLTLGQTNTLPPPETTKIFSVNEA